MTAADVIASLRSRGFQVALAEGKLVVSPGSRLNDAERADLGKYKTAIVDLLHTDPAGQPDAPCALCGETTWAWEPAWHHAPHRRDGHDHHDDGHHGRVEDHGADHTVHDDLAAGQRGVWVYRICITRPVPTLIELYATLTDNERKRLAVEVKSGDRLASHVIVRLGREDG